jgi:hypothetical protein
MSGQLNEYLADQATMLVRESFTDVRAEWWWERRIGGGVEICQELDPVRAGRELSQETGVSRERATKAVMSELGLDEEARPETVVLTFEVSGESTAEEVSGLLSERSATPEGIAAPIYARARAALL